MHTNHEHGVPAIGRLLEWWHETRDRWARMAELRSLAPDELERVACDFGVSASELMDMAERPGGTQGLLEKRLAALNLDPEEIRALSPMILRDLERTCSMCPERKQCKDDMAVSALEPGWESYCPNSGTLRTLA